MQKSTAPHIRLGKQGELVAIRFLQRKGFEILGHSVKLHSAEIDIIARDGATFVLVEVKTLRQAPGSDRVPEANYSEEQKMRQRRAAKELEHKFKDPNFPFRHDLVQVFMGRIFPHEIRHITDYYRYKNTDNYSFS